MMLPNPGMATRFMKGNVDEALRDAERDRLIHEAKGAHEANRHILTDLLSRAHTLLLSPRAAFEKRSSPKIRGESRSRLGGVDRHATSSR